MEILLYNYYGLSSHIMEIPILIMDAVMHEH